MITYDSEVVIDRPQAEVAQFAVDPSTHREWMGDVADIEVLTPGAVRVDSRYRYLIKKGPMSTRLTMRVAALDQGAVEYRTEPGGPLDWQARLGFEPIDGGRTRVTSAGKMVLRGWRRLIEPLMAGEVRSGEAAELTALKRILESRSDAEPSQATGG